MKKRILFLTIVASTFLTSCAVLKTTSTSKTMDIYGAGVIQTPVLADLDVKETKVTGTATAAAAEGPALETIKHDAVADALKKANADVLVEPKFETETSGGRTTATVTGYPATYKNFRSIKAEDVQLLQVGVTQKAEVYEPPKVEKKKGGAAAVAGILLGIVLVTVIIVALAIG